MLVRTHSWPRSALARVLWLLPFAFSSLVQIDQAVPDTPGWRSLRGGDIALAEPAWERRQIHSMIREASATYGVDPALVRAVVWVESRYDPFAVSPKGARGLMQLTPATARHLGVANAFDPRQNVFGGVKYLSMLIDQHGGDVALALASYNAGPNAVRRHGGVPPYEQTQGYLRKIRQRFRGLPEPPPSGAE